MPSHRAPTLRADKTAPTGAASDVWTEQRIRALGAVTDLPTAARIFGLGRALAYELAKNGAFPVPVLRIGTRYRVPTAPLLTALHLPVGDDLTGSGQPSVDHHTEIRSVSPPHAGTPTPHRGEP